VTVRLAAVLAVAVTDDLSLAMLEDTYEVVAGLDRVGSVLAVCPPEQPDAERVIWPGTPVIRLAEQTVHGGPAALLLGTLAGLADLGAEEATVVAADAPDLPPLLLGKLYRALGSADVAVCAAEGGGLVALAARLPAPPWLAQAGVGLDTRDARERLAATAPRRRALGSGPGWHRIRTPDDLSRLDPGLEGWDATRALLARSRGSRPPAG
jgi:molybdopterin-guanine dinucleotide biosynthesis protein A